MINRLHCHQRWFCGFLISAGLIYSFPVTAADNMRMHGALVYEACDIQPGDEDQTIEMGLRSDLFFYHNTRTPSRNIILNLINCDTSIGNMVTITFTGNESSELPGYLAPDAGSAAAGIALGIETPAGDLLPVNDATGITYPIVNGHNVINLKGFIQGEPSALANHNIKLGPYSAVTTFNLDYN